MTKDLFFDILFYGCLIPMLIVSVFQLVKISRLVKNGQRLHSSYMRDWMIACLPFISLFGALAIVIIIIDNSLASLDKFLRKNYGM